MLVSLFEFLIEKVGGLSFENELFGWYAPGPGESFLLLSLGFPFIVNLGADFPKSVLF